MLTISPHRFIFYPKENPQMIKFRLAVLMAQHPDGPLKQTAVAQQTGIRTGTISDIYDSKLNRISTDTINKLCKFFSCTPGDLIEYIPDDQTGKSTF